MQCGCSSVDFFPYPFILSHSSPLLLFSSPLLPLQLSLSSSGGSLRTGVLGRRDSAHFPLGVSGGGGAGGSSGGGGGAGGRVDGETDSGRHHRSTLVLTSRRFLAQIPNFSSCLHVLKFLWFKNHLKNFLWAIRPIFIDFFPLLLHYVYFLPAQFPAGCMIF